MQNLFIQYSKIQNGKILKLQKIFFSKLQSTKKCKVQTLKKGKVFAFHLYIDTLLVFQYLHMLYTEAEETSISLLLCKVNSGWYNPLVSKFSSLQTLSRISVIFIDSEEYGSEVCIFYFFIPFGCGIEF